MKHCRRVIILIFIMAAIVALFSPASFATGLEVAAGVVGSLEALGIDLAVSAGTAYILDSIAYQIPGSVYVPDFSDDTLYQFLTVDDDAPTIRIRDQKVVIDGVEYSDIWLPYDSASKFKTEAFDFITRNNIIDQSSGIYASGVGYAGDVPIYDVSGSLQSQNFVLPLNTSGIVGRWTFSSIVYPTTHVVSLTDNITSQSNQNSSIEPPYFALRQLSSGRLRANYGVFTSPSSSQGAHIDYDFSLFTSDPFDFTWVSSSIPVDPLPSSDYGLSFRVPSSLLSSIPSVISPDLSQYQEFINALGAALKASYDAETLKRASFEKYDEPIDPPVPVSGTIAEEPYTSLDGSLNGIQDSLDNIDTNIGTVDESLDDIQVYAEDAADSLQSIDTNLSQSVADTAGIKGFIQQYLPGVHSLLNSISTSVSNIAGSVAAADETFFGNVVDAIVAPFTPVFDIFKSGVGIWRYVVAWVGNISAPFSWIWNILSQANGILVSPILASAAAAVVLAVYKRFGR